MNKKSLFIIGLLMATILIFATTLSFATDGNGAMNDVNNAVNDVRNTVGGAENAIEGAVKDVTNTTNMGITRDNAQNMRLCDELYKRREQDVQEKADLFARLGSRISELEKKEAATAAALPLMFELNKVNAERYADNCCCKSEKDLLKATCALQSKGMAVANNLQRQLDHKIDGQLKYAYSDLCAPVPSIAPLYCSPFTSYGTGMYAGTAASNFNAINTAINTVTDRCPSCTAQ